MGLSKAAHVIGRGLLAHVSDLQRPCTQLAVQNVVVLAVVDWAVDHMHAKVGDAVV